jgi:hypothetical protein
MEMIPAVSNIYTVPLINTSINLCQLEKESSGTKSHKRIKIGINEVFLYLICHLTSWSFAGLFRPNPLVTRGGLKNLSCGTAFQEVDCQPVALHLAELPRRPPMEKKPQGIGLALCAFALYIIGGISIFGGLALIGFTQGRDVWGLGEGRPLGYLFLCVGLVLSILGVLLMRIFRNRGFRGP